MGTPPYTSVWSNGVVGPNAYNLPPIPSLHVLTITDVNSCIDTVRLSIKDVYEMNHLCHL